MAARLRQFGSLPSVQNLDVPFLSQRVEAAFGETSTPASCLSFASIVRASFTWTPEGELRANAVPSDMRRGALAVGERTARTPCNCA